MGKLILNKNENEKIVWVIILHILFYWSSSINVYFVPKPKGQLWLFWVFKPWQSSCGPLNFVLWTNIKSNLIYCSEHVFLGKKLTFHRVKLMLTFHVIGTKIYLNKVFTDKWITYLKDSICVCIYSLNMELKMTMEVNKIM